MGKEFDQYLAYTVYRCVKRLAPEDQDLTNENAGNAGSVSGALWDLRSHGWPPPPTPSEIAAARSWIGEQFEEVCKQSSFKPIYDPDRPLEIVSLHSLSDTTIPGGAVNDPDASVQALMCPLIPRILRNQNCISQTALRRLLPILGEDSFFRGGYSVNNLSPTSEDAIIDRAIRSLYDWRATLSFLSELRLAGNELLVDEPDHSVIDSFNVHITRGRKPSLLHNMLCHLAGPARFRTIITTNFDTLIEDAFRQMVEHVEVISVSVKGTLPDPELVHARNTVVKMHGTTWETRADFSLDSSPDPEAKRRFFHYVRGHYPELAGVPSSPRLPEACLLVIGYSGGDRLCLELIKYLLDAGGPSSRVYWICHSETGVKRLGELFQERYRGRLVVVATDRSDLLLYEWYQQLCLSLPRGGFTYQYTPNVAPEVDRPHQKHPLGPSHDELVAWFSDREAADSAGAVSFRRNLRVVDGGPGVLATLRNTVQTLTAKVSYHPVWLELEDYADTFCLAYEFLQLISIQLGLFQVGHADLVPKEVIESIKKDHNDELKMREAWMRHIGFLVQHYYNIVPGDWLVVLYGRNGPGGCSGWNLDCEVSKQGWTVESEYGNENGGSRFKAFVEALAHLGFRTIYAPYSETRHQGSGESWDNLRRYIREELMDDPNENAFEVAELNRAPIAAHSEVSLRRLLQVSLDDKGPLKPDEVEDKDPRKVTYQNAMRSLLRKLVFYFKSRHDEAAGHDFLETMRFLYSATLFRQSRHYSAFLNDGVMKCPFRFNSCLRDNDYHRSNRVTQLLDELFEMGIYYKKPGGFAWSYRDFRLGVRAILGALPRGCLSLAKPSLVPFVQWRSHHHHAIADWYLRAFYTTGHGMPLMEAMYHLAQAIRHLGQFRQSGPFNSPKSSEMSASTERRWRRYVVWRKCVCDMIKALRLGRSAIRFWLGAPQLNAWFGKDKVEALMKLTREMLPEGPFAGPRGEVLELGRHARGLTDLLRAELDELVPSCPAEPRLRRFIGVVEFGGAGDRDGGSKVAEWEVKTLVLGTDQWSIPTVEPVQRLVVQLSRGRTPARVHKVFRKWLFECVRKDASDGSMLALLQHCNEAAFQVLRYAKMKQLVEGFPSAESGFGALAITQETRTHWVVVTVLCNAALELCRLVHPNLDAIEHRERVKALCIYAVGLARLGRFFEAHRRLNDASALLSKLGLQDREVLLGILKIRRAEAHVMESMFVRELTSAGKPGSFVAQERAALQERYSFLAGEKRGLDEHKLLRFRMAKLDDAWVALESAERLLAGVLHSSRWWARLCAMKLKCLVEYPNLSPWPSTEAHCFRPLARRVPVHPAHQVYSLLCKGLSSCQGDEGLRLRLVDYSLRLIMRVSPYDGAVVPDNEHRLVRDRIRKISEEVLEAEFLGVPLIQRYATCIREFLKVAARPVTGRRRSGQLRVL